MFNGISNKFNPHSKQSVNFYYYLLFSVLFAPINPWNLFLVKTPAYFNMSLRHISERKIKIRGISMSLSVQVARLGFKTPIPQWKPHTSQRFGWTEPFTLLLLQQHEGHIHSASFKLQLRTNKMHVTDELIKVSYPNLVCPSFVQKWLQLTPSVCWFCRRTGTEIISLRWSKNEWIHFLMLKSEPLRTSWPN